jgi:hypothetical protein
MIGECEQQFLLDASVRDALAYFERSTQPQSVFYSSRMHDEVANDQKTKLHGRKCLVLATAW